MPIRELIEGAILILGGAGTLSGILLNWRNKRLSDRKAIAEIELDDATQAKLVRDAAHSVEQDYLNRLQEFRAEIARLNKELNHERDRAAEWRDRLLLFEDFFFTKHMPWDRRMTLVARSHDWEIEDPPSVLEYMKEIQRRMEDDAQIYREKSSPSYRHRDS